MKRLIYIFVFIALTGSTFTQQVELSKIFDIYFQQDFEDDTPGNYIYSQFLEDFNYPSYVGAPTNYGSVDYWTECGKMKICEENGNKFMRHLTDKGEVGLSYDSGMEWYTPLDSEYEEAYFSYRIRFKPDFEPVLSGKIGGGTFASPRHASGQPPEYDDGYTQVLTWAQAEDKSWKDLVQYIYHHDHQEQYGDSYRLNYGLPDGVWITITTRIVLNTVTDNKGNNDGICETFIDGKLYQQKTNFKFRNYESIKIDNLTISNFFGGLGDEFASIRDEYCDFDDFIVFTYNPGVNVPHGNVPSTSDRKLYLPYDEFNDSDWRKSLSANAISNNMVGLEWDNYFYPVNYTIQRRTESETVYQDIVTLDPSYTSYQNTGLLSNTTYYYRIKTENSISDPLIVTTLLPLTLQAPTSLVSLLIEKFAIKIGWNDNSTNESGFIIERSDITSDNFMQIDTVNPNVTEFINNILTPNTDYHYRVKAFNQDGQSEYSDTLFVHTNSIIVPLPPSELKIISLTPFSAIISWNDNSSNETGFQIQRADQNNAFTSLGDMPSGMVQYNDSELEQNSVYHYRIRAYNNDGYSVFSDTLTIQTPEDIIPPVPENFKTDLVKYNNVVLSWNVDMTHINGFEIERATDTSGYELIAGTGIVTTFSDTAVAEGIDYLYRIRSYNTYHSSSYSLPLNVSVPFILLPEPPELLSPANIESNTIAIKWSDKSTDESGFKIKRALYPQTDYKELFTTGANDTLFIDRTVMPNTTYYYMVNAVNEKGQSENSNQLRVSSLSLSEAARFRERLIAYYNFSLNSDTVIHDLSNFGNPLNLLITDTMGVYWTKNSRFEIISSTMIHSQYPAFKIVDACKKTNEITLECWIKPNLTAYNSDATIISLSQDPENIAISMMQSDYSFSENINYRYLFGLSTKSTEISGRPYLTTDENDFVTLHHVAYTRNKQGEERLFLNGAMVANSIKPLGFDNWKNDYYLYLGNESTMEKPWMGMFYLMAIYDIALTSDQVLQNYQAGPTDNITVTDHAYEIKLFPNPSNGRINIDINPTQYGDYGEKAIFQLVDLNGYVHLQEVISDSNQPFHKEFDLSYLNKGIYYFRLISPAYTTTQKITLF